MKVRIVTEGEGQWGILRRMSLELADRLPYVSLEGPGDLWYFVNYALFSPKPLTAGWFTHREDNHLGEIFDQVAKSCDIQICNSWQTEELVTIAGGRNTKVIHPGGSLCNRRSAITFGVCGQVKHTGRKGEHLVKLMMDHGFDVVAHGYGWPCPIIGNQVDQLQEFYDRIDYLVVTSTNEGGPQPVVDAISYGVPVIAPDVGMCWDFPVIRYERNNWQSLEGTLNALGRPRTWGDWASDHHELFSSVLDRHLVEK